MSHLPQCRHFMALTLLSRRCVASGKAWLGLLSGWCAGTGRCAAGCLSETSPTTLGSSSTPVHDGGPCLIKSAHSHPRQVETIRYSPACLQQPFATMAAHLRPPVCCHQAQTSWMPGHQWLQRWPVMRLQVGCAAQTRQELLSTPQTQPAGSLGLSISPLAGSVVCLQHNLLL